jgi:hypothetical protein
MGFCIHIFLSGDKGPQWRSPRHTCISGGARIQELIMARPSELPLVPLRLFVSVAEAKLALNIGHTKLYKLIADGRLAARMLDGRTLITHESLIRLVHELPPLEPGAYTRSTQGAAGRAVAAEAMVKRKKAAKRKKPA